MGKGNGCKGVDSMVFVWSIILIAVSVIFLLAGVLNVSGDLPDGETTGGPWYMWWIIVMAIVVVFVILYMISMQYAETAIATKYLKDDEDIDMQATKKLTGSQRV